MSMRGSWWLPRLVVILVAVGLPIVGHRVRRDAEPRCALDGVRVEPVYRVQILDHEGEAHDFCCIHCAEIWLERQRSPFREVLVTDEVSGRPINPDSAYFVRSWVVTVPTSGNRVHVFANEADAEEHARVAGGMLLLGPERPFRGEPASGDAPHPPNCP
jgi:hypothetical protein